MTLNKIDSILFWISLYCSSVGHFFFFPVPCEVKVDEDIINKIINSLKS